MVGARRLPTLHWVDVYGGCASLTHPTLGRSLWWVRVAYPPYIEATFMVDAVAYPPYIWAAFMVGARCLPTLHWRGVYGGCASLTYPTSGDVYGGCRRLPTLHWRGVYGGCALLTHPTLGRRLWRARVAYPPYIGAAFMVGARCLPTLHWEGVGGWALLTHPTEFTSVFVGRVSDAHPPLAE